MDFRQTFFLLLDHYLVNYSGEIQGYNIRLTPVVDCLFSSHVYWIKYGYFKEMRYVNKSRMADSSSLENILCQNSHHIVFVSVLSTVPWIFSISNIGRHCLQP